MKFPALIFAGVVGAALLGSSTVHGAGADILMGEFGSTSHFGPIGGIHAYSLGSYTCNIGDSSLAWINRGTPGFAMNAYRLHGGRLVHVGMGNAKTACCVVNVTDTPRCGTVCSASGFGLRPGCRDHYSASFNSGQSRLAPRSFMNPQTGVISTAYPSTTGDAIFRRMQIQQADMTAATYPGALYFVEGHYVCQEDAAAGNDLNNASYQRVNIDASYNMSLQTPMFAGVPAIFAWRDHGLGVGIPDPSVTIQAVDVPSEGRFIVGHKVIDNGDGTWRYEYAVYNFNSDRAGGSFAVPLPKGAVVTNIGFNSPDYNSGEIYSNADWVSEDHGFEVRWSSPQSFGENVNTNALRWGTLYNFWFTCDRAPVASEAVLDLFKPAVGCQPVSITAALAAPGATCDTDVVRSGSVDIDDLLSVIGAWGPCACAFSCGGDVVADSDVNIDDLLAVIAAWGPCP